MGGLVFGIVGLLLYGLDALIMMDAQSAIHEIFAGVCAIVATLFLIAGQFTSLHR
jgi:hypothetical protein